MQYNFIRILFFLLITSFIFSCTKNETPNPIISHFDNIKPLSYYPVFPGSYWVYLKDGIDTVIETSGPDYIKHSFLGPSNQQTDTVYVPTMYNIPIYQYQRFEHIPILYVGDDLIDILSEEVGKYLNFGFVDRRWGATPEIAYVKQKGIGPQGDSVIIIDGHWENPLMSPINTRRHFIEYTKDIGKTREFYFDSTTFDTTYRLILINYHINK